ncbi:MAG: imelysin family protein [Gammaproteobacteria bacterium]|nr:imelysin family protein [Gammaproteobacteria bacterium]MDD9896715.1 imelysin family protein [Gammaproteobacteria bacterium]MDD9958713.1 imelysin family protein [Gammaproteobacteria bacterium]
MLRIALVSMVILLAACSYEEQPETARSSNGGAGIGDVAPVLDPAYDSPIRSIMAGYLKQIEADYDVLASELSRLNEQISAFLEYPHSDTMNEMRSSWLTTHSSYELTTLHRYFAELILAEEDTLALYQLQYQMNHWPILPGYVDYVAGYQDSGIVNDINVSLDIPTLQEQHGMFDLAEASLGFHVLEFLIWGENPDRQSERPPSDYFIVRELSTAEIENGMELEQLSNNRRRQMLGLNGESLLDDFNSSRAIWTAGSRSFQAGLSDLNSTEMVILLLEAMTSMLTEEVLVRSLYPMLNGDYYESIQSPFSFSTQNAVAAQLSSVERLLLEISDDDVEKLDSILVSLSADFGEFFYQNFDASKECLVLLYSTLEVSADTLVSAEAEFAVVECINLLTNMIDYLEQIKISLYQPV